MAQAFTARSWGYIYFNGTTAPEPKERNKAMIYKLFAVCALGILAIEFYFCLVVASDADDQNEKNMRDLDDDDE